MMLNIPSPAKREEPENIENRRGIFKSVVGYTHPFSIKNQARYTALNYLVHRSYFNNIMEQGLKWQGVTGFRGLAGGTDLTSVGSGVTGRFGKGISNLSARAGSKIISKYYGPEYGGAFYKRGLKGVVEFARATSGKKNAHNIIYRAAQIASGGNEATLFATKETAERLTSTRGFMDFLRTSPEARTIHAQGGRAARTARDAARQAFIKAGKTVNFDVLDDVGKSAYGKVTQGMRAPFMKTPLVGKVVSKGWMRGIKFAGKTANYAGWIALIASASYKLGKFTVGVVDKRLARLANRLQSLSSPDVFTVPQLANKYSMSMRERALQEIHRSNFSPKNMMLGNEAQYMHK